MSTTDENSDASSAKRLWNIPFSWTYLELRLRLSKESEQKVVLVWVFATRFAEALITIKWNQVACWLHVRPTKSQVSLRIVTVGPLFV